MNKNTQKQKDPQLASNTAAPHIPLYIQLKERVRQEIRKSGIAEGERFMTLSQLAKHLNVSTGTANKVLAALQEEGVLSAQRGRGIFVCNQNATKIPCIALIIPGFIAPNHAFIVEWIEGLREEGTACGYNVTTISMATGITSMQSNEFINELVSKKILSGVILFPSDVTHDEYQWLKDNGVAVTLAGAQYNDPSAWSVMEYPDESHRDILDFLTGLGHNRIGVVASIHRPHPDIDETKPKKTQDATWRIKAWEVHKKIQQQYALEGKIDNEPELFHTLNPVLPDAVENIFNWYQKYRPSVMYITDEILAYKILQEFPKRDISVPDDVSIMTRGSSEIPEEITAWILPCQKAGRTCIRLIKQQLEGDLTTQRQVSIYGQIRRGQTVKIHC